MKNIFKTLVGLFIATYLISCSDMSTGKQPKLTNHLDTISYAIGLWIGMGPANVHDKDELDLNLMKKGIANGISESDSTWDIQKLQNMLVEFSNKQQAKAAEVQQQEGIDFLKENKTKDGVIETASGLQYEILEEGVGISPTATDTVDVQYKGSFIDGKIFESSYETGDTVTFPLNRVIPGWTEGIQLMSEGAKFKFTIPSQIAYGPRGNQGIPPNSTLIFEVELLKVKKSNPVE